MYKHYETSEDVFVDREEFIEWMDEALVRCKKKNIVLHLKGIGGIGKSSLLNHWVNTHEKTIRLDCEQYSDFFQRLNMLAKGAVLQGVKLQRFDILWQIRQRFVEGVEPVREEGREWAKEVVMAIPFIGSLASIGSAINAVGAKVTPKLKGKYGTAGKWLQETLGKNHIEQLLEILWKDPRRAEFLYLSALLEDVNARDNSNIPLLFLLDHFEYVDDEKTQWRYQGKRISETELWTLFLSKLSKCVGVMASRKSAAISKIFQIEETELTELDKDSCIELLELQGVTDQELQDRIVSVSGGNPFVLDAICDMTDAIEASISDIEGLRADTLSEVRLKVWRRLFREAEGLHNLINRAGILPYFSEGIMRIVSPEMTPDNWDRLRRLSFVKMRSDGSFVLHELAKDLVRAELSDSLSNLAGEVSDLLEKKYNEKSELYLLGMAISVLSITSTDDSISKLRSSVDDLIDDGLNKEAFLLLNSTVFESDDGHSAVRGLNGKVLWRINRYTEAEIELRSSIEYFQNLESGINVSYMDFTADCFTQLGHTSNGLLDINNARDAFQEAINIRRELVKTSGYEYLIGLSQSLLAQSRLIYEREPDTAERLALEAIQTLDRIDDTRKERRLAELGGAYDILGGAQGNLFKWDEWDTTMRKALEFQRELFGLKPETPSVMNKLAAYSNNLGLSMWLRGREVEVRELLEQAEYYNRKAAELQPDTYRWSLSIALQNFGFYNLKVRYLIVAEKYFREATSFLEYLAQDVKGQWLGYLGYVLSGLAYVCLEMGEFQEAVKLVGRALEIRWDLMKHVPWGPGLGFALNTAGIIHSKIKNESVAEESFKKAIEVLEGTEIDPKHVPLFLASALNNYGILLLQGGRIDESIDILGRAVQVLRIYRQRAPELHPGWVAETVTNLAVAQKRNGNLDDAEELLKEALDFTSRLIDIAPESYLYYKMHTLQVYSSLLRQKGNKDEAEILREESISFTKKCSDLGMSISESGMVTEDEGRFLIIY